MVESSQLPLFPILPVYVPIGKTGNKIAFAWRGDILTNMLPRIILFKYIPFTTMIMYLDKY